MDKKKRDAKLAAIFSTASTVDNDSPTAVTLSDVGPDFAPCTLPEIRARLVALMDALPKELPGVPDENESSSNTNKNDTPSHQAIKSFASSIQIVIEQYNLLLSLVSSATYKWGVDRSGASQQNLSVMVSELQQCQEMISSTVSGRLSNVLCPAVDVLVGEVEIIRNGATTTTSTVENEVDEDVGTDSNGSKKRKLNNTHDLDNNSNTTTNNERRINHYIRAQVDPAYVHLSHVILARNAQMIRHTVATSIFTAQKVISDYLTAMKKDTGGHNSFNL